MNLTYWIIAGLALFVVEIITPGSFFFACLGIGALCSALVSVFISVTWIQFAVFVAGSLISMYTIRPLAKRLIKSEGKKSNVDELIGQKAPVTELINPPNFGRVKISGEIWMAQGEEKIEPGSMVEILAVEGTKLKVRKI
ncbi:MAG: NfeD family protein [Elusimicrobia bacterium]|nr:NfeD family protein [Elusimicrobiota bacterium]